jgi:hypothetical protein
MTALHMSLQVAQRRQAAYMPKEDFDFSASIEISFH